MKNELNTCFQQKFAIGSYGVGIGRAWCSRKACEICSSLVQKKKLKKNYFSSHKLPKQQSTSFWSQGILGVNFLHFSSIKEFFFVMIEEVEEILIDVFFEKVNSLSTIQNHENKSLGISNNVILIQFLDMTSI
jgi:hypothetical protein